MAAQGPMTVRLEPCGLAMARLVGPDGKPVTGQPRGVIVTIVVTPGPPFRPAGEGRGLAADEDVLGRIDPVNHGNGWVADRSGADHLAGPDPWRDLSHHRPHRWRRRRGAQIRREFVVGPGEALELGDVLIQKPPR